jgi:murein DD-endopeptidase MepM/ murein hydrolase activator NlpD
MRIQWHPGSGKRQVVAFEISARGQRILVALLAAAALLLAVLPLSLSTVLLRWRRRAADEEAALLNARRKEALEVATSGLRETDERLANDRDLLLRILYLYDLHALLRAPDPLAEPPPDPEGRLAATEREIEILSRVVEAIRDVEARNPDWARATPSIAPLPEAVLVIAEGFGWRVSKLTSETEFSTGADLAAPEGSPAYAPADGVVRWAGSFPLRARSPYGHLGKIVAIRHGDRMVTVFGNLASVAVKREARVRRGEKIGTVGQSRWVNAPRLRYEVWRLGGAAPQPINPAIAMLNIRVADVPGILKKAAARTSAHNYAPLPAEMR